MWVNVVGTITALLTARAAGVQRFVFVSSHRVTLDGPADGQDETAPHARAPIDAWTRATQHAERAVLEADGRGGMRTLALRPADVWGSDGRLVETFLAQLVSGRFTRWIGRSTDVLDRTHRDTLVRAMLLGAVGLRDAPARTAGQAYFITDDERHGPTEWFAPMVERLGYPLPRWRRVARTPPPSPMA